MENILKVEGVSKVYSISSKHKPYLSLREKISERISGKRTDSKRFLALDDISFNVKAGDTLGIIGNNGAGKSTLLKIISKITPPTKGRITFKGRVASLLEVGTGFHPELTGKENIFLNGSILGLKKHEIIKKLEEIVDFSGVERFLDTPLKHFSSGMKLRLAFSVAAHLEPEILIVDEVLAVGDYEFQKKCLGKMEEVSSERERTILFVSHNLEAVERLCQKVICLEKGKKVFEGDTTSGINFYTRNTNFKKKIYNKGSVVEEVEVIHGTPLTIKVKYNFDYKPVVPHFGFVIYNNNGKPIFGSNPTLANASSAKDYPASGEVKVEIQSPEISYGIYNLSIWMGDGVNTYLEDHNCITFEIPANGQLNRKIGFIKPNCKYTYG